MPKDTISSARYWDPASTAAGTYPARNPTPANVQSPTQTWLAGPSTTPNEPVSDPFAAELEESQPLPRTRRPSVVQTSQPPRRMSTAGSHERPPFDRSYDPRMYEYQSFERPSLERPSFSLPTHPLRANDAVEREYMKSRHPDMTEGRRKPPRAYRNAEPWESIRPAPSQSGMRSEFEDPSPPMPPPHGRTADEEMAYGHYNSERPVRPRLDYTQMTASERKEVMRLPWTHWMRSDFKNHFVASLGEFVGTTMFLTIAFSGTQVANINSSTSSTTTSGGATGFDVSVYLYISLIFGFSLAVNVWVFFRISGGLFNPAVTLGMLLVGAVDGTRAVCLFISQILGSIAASGIVYGLFPTPFNVRTTLSGGTSIAQGIIIEALLTAELVFTIFMLAKEKHRATFIAPVGIGLALFISEMIGVYYTGGSLNPARSFGPCVVSRTFDTEHWIYWVGPLVGSLIAVIFYKLIKMLEYEVANPGQDAIHHTEAEEATEVAEKRQAASNSVWGDDRNSDDGGAARSVAQYEGDYNGWEYARGHTARSNRTVS